MATIMHTCDLLHRGAENLLHWHQIINHAYFPLRLQVDDKKRFYGQLRCANLGSVSLSRLRSSAALYERHHNHLNDSCKTEYLITLPRKNPITFNQSGKEVCCEPGQFVIQRGDAPYHFSYSDANDLLVLKVERSVLVERIAHPERFCASVFSTHSGSAKLFATMLFHAQHEISTTANSAAEIIGRQLLELLQLSLEERPSTPIRHNNARDAHLQRIERFIREHLDDNTLSPEKIALACGISLRYLHHLCRDLGTTISRQVREQRLIAARDHLRMSSAASIADTAYRFGFTDQSQFSRQFGHRFGITPSAWQRQRQDAASPTHRPPPLAS